MLYIDAFQNILRYSIDKKLDRRGFSSLELLGVILIAIIVITGVTMFLSKTVNSQREKAFINLAKAYGNETVSNYINGNITCAYNGQELGVTDLPNGDFSILLNNDKSQVDGELKTAYRNATRLVNEGGKSPWGNGKIRGFVTINLNGLAAKNFSVQLIDDSGHAIIDNPDKELSFLKLSEKSIVKNNYTLDYAFKNASQYRCKID